MSLVKRGLRLYKLTQITVKIDDILVGKVSENFDFAEGVESLY